MARSPGSIARVRRRAFTLIELLVGVLVTAAVCGATTVALSQALKAKTNAESRRQAFARASTAVERLAADAVNTLRSDDLYRCRVRVSDGGTGDSAADQLLIFTKSLQPTRPLGSQNEGDHYEVQYRLQPDTRPTPQRATRAAAPAPNVLWRRVDPVPDENPEGGGVAFPFVERVAGLSIEAFDGRNWLPTWDSDAEGMPHALRITCWATSEDGSRRAAARRVIAFDRTPVPASTAATESDGGAG
ncbi:MAG: type II secretion system protein GspJ [Phycisphaerales bacterium]